MELSSAGVRIAVTFHLIWLPVPIAEPRGDAGASARIEGEAPEER
jgi:hypothetical protein